MLKAHLWLLLDSSRAARLVMGPRLEMGAAAEQFLPSARAIHLRRMLSSVQCDACHRGVEGSSRPEGHGEGAFVVDLGHQRSCTNGHGTTP